ncbi:DUF445 domain-containing protein [Ornithinimicrobium sp. F0845]|uniref:DUF445 domain-containing protein n=1 Tax=Ornithinimicrobium sp. F0845 TaxID=2926412 RepID=UPI001FF6822A|nr:DUF445 domain-containing protein [Ornithinimicrobium sp. F0845]MCK0112611.1 DUF445 domain-containing protein [Ornithinimicrobium sp. F0845]
MTTATPTVGAGPRMPNLSEGDLARRANLRRMRWLATGLLVLAAIVFVLTHGHGGFWGYVNAASEAAMVGAVADWFAVTALFRHPLGLPVPHTAIIPRRKDMLARSLEEFVAGNFLTEQTIRERYLDAQVTRRLGEWLSDPVNAERVIQEASPLAAQALERVGGPDLQEFIEQTLLPRVRKEPLSPLAGHLLEQVVQDKAHHGLMDIAFRELHTWLAVHPEDVRRIIAARAPSWSPTWLDDVVVGRIYTELVAWAREVDRDKEHRVRLALDSYLADLSRDMQHDPDTIATTEQLKERLLDHPQVAPSLLAVWDAVKVVLLEQLGDPQGVLRTRLAQELQDLGHRMVSDDILRPRLDAWGADAAAVLVSRYGSELTTVISHTIERWDGRDAADRIELHVGRDLQFIRINGTVVGGLVGLLIHTVSQLL